MAIHALGKGGTEARFLLAAPIASIAQLDRVLVFETMGREFESLWGLQYNGLWVDVLLGQ